MFIFKLFYMRILPLMPIMLLITPVLFAQSKKERVLLSLERARFEAMTQKDVAFLKRVLDVSLTYTHSNGLVESKDEHIARIASGQIVYRAIQPQHMDVRLYGKTAVLTGVINVQGRYQERDFDLKLRYIDVYVRRPMDWKLVAWQSVRVD